MAGDLVGTRPWAGIALCLGAIGFLTFWLLVLLSLGDGLPWALTLGLHAASGILIIAGVIGLQVALARDSTRDHPLGWLAVALVALAMFVSFEILMVAMIVYGVARWTVRRPAALALAAGGTLFLVTRAASAPFWSQGDPTPVGVARAGYLSGLLLVVAGLLDLGWPRRGHNHAAEAALAARPRISERDG